MTNNISRDSDARSQQHQVITACAFIHHNIDGVEKVFLAKRAATKKFKPGVHELPGGHIEFGEEIGVGLEREIQEELGMQIRRGDPFWVFTYLDRGRSSHAIEVIYFAEFAELVGKIKINPEDHSEYGWYSEDELHLAMSEEKPESDMEIQGIRNGFALLKGQPPSFK